MNITRWILSEFLKRWNKDNRIYTSTFIMPLAFQALMQFCWIEIRSPKSAIINQRKFLKTQRSFQQSQPAKLHHDIDDNPQSLKFCQQALAIASDLGIPPKTDCETLLWELTGDEWGRGGGGGDRSPIHLICVRAKVMWNSTTGPSMPSLLITML